MIVIEKPIRINRALIEKGFQALVFHRIRPCSYQYLSLSMPGPAP